MKDFYKHKKFLPLGVSILLLTLMTPSMLYAVTLPSPESPPPVKVQKPSTGNIIKDIGGGILNDIACSKGSLGERIEGALHEAAIEQGTELTQKGLDFINNEILKDRETWTRIAELGGTIGGIASIGIPGVGPIIGGIMGNLLGGDKEKRFKEEESRLKEGCFDALARVAAINVLSEMTGETLLWIQEGFENSNPGFVTNLRERFQEIEDSEVYRFITSDTFVQSTCYIFRDDIYRDQYERQYNYTDRIDPSSGLAVHIPQVPPGSNLDLCDFELALGGADKAKQFVEGDFSAGGWEGWFNYTKNPLNNPVNAKFLLRTETEGRIAEAREFEQTEITSGGGYISMRQCQDGSQPISPTLCTDKSHPKIITPSSLVKDLVSNALISESKQAELTDELNETVDQFTSWTLSTIFKKDRGLLQAQVATIDEREVMLAKIDTLFNQILGQIKYEEQFRALTEEMRESIHTTGLSTNLLNNTDYDPGGGIIAVECDPSDPNLQQCLDGGGRLPGSGNPDFESLFHTLSDVGGKIDALQVVRDIENCSLATYEEKIRAQDIRTRFTSTSGGFAIARLYDLLPTLLKYRATLAKASPEALPANITRSNITYSTLRGFLVGAGIVEEWQAPRSRGLLSGLIQGGFDAISDYVEEYLDERFDREPKREPTELLARSLPLENGRILTMNDVVAIQSAFYNIDMTDAVEFISMQNRFNGTVTDIINLAKKRAEYGCKNQAFIGLVITSWGPTGTETVNSNPDSKQTSVSVMPEDKVTLSWSAGGSFSGVCTASSVPETLENGSKIFSGNKNFSTSETVGPIEQDTTLSLTCGNVLTDEVSVKVISAQTSSGITLLGESTITLNEGSAPVDPGYTVSNDYKDSPVSISVKRNGVVVQTESFWGNASLPPSTYLVTYSINSGGKTISRVRTIIIKAPSDDSSDQSNDSSGGQNIKNNS